MTNYSPINSIAANQSEEKGSIYGKAIQAPSPHSFQQSSRSNRPIYQYRIKILSTQAFIYPLHSHSIITRNEVTRGPSLTRSS